jgi:hypothetical protein
VFSLKEESAVRSRDATKGGSRKGPQQSRAAAPTNQAEGGGRLARFTRNLFHRTPSHQPPQQMQPNVVQRYESPNAELARRWVVDPHGPVHESSIEQPLAWPSGGPPSASSSGSDYSDVSSFLKPRSSVRHLQARNSNESSVRSFESSSAEAYFRTNFFRAPVPTHRAPSNSSGSMAAPVHPQGGPVSEASSVAERIAGFSGNSSVRSLSPVEMNYVTLMPQTPQTPQTPPVQSSDPRSSGMPPQAPVVTATPVSPRLAQGPVELSPPLPSRAPIGASPAGVVPVMRNPQATGYLPAQIPAGTMLSYHVDPARGLGIFAHTGAPPSGTRPLGMPTNGLPGHLLGAHASPVQPVASPQNVEPGTITVRL